MDESRRTRVMGVLNVTPDSFSDGGEFLNAAAAVDHALQMLADGADIIDVGGESTRPGAQAVDEHTELARVVPVVAAIHVAAPDAVISIDTTKATVADMALAAGAQIVNDISGLGFDPRMAAVVGEHDATLVIMHIRGTPQTMRWSRRGDESTDDPHYDDVIAEIATFLCARADEAIGAGVTPERIIVDPGIGFGKTREQNLEILHRLSELVDLGYPVLVGTSRKSFLGAVTGRPVGERAFATAASVALAVAAGASVVRVHDVPEMVDVVRVAEAIAY